MEEGGWGGFCSVSADGAPTSALAVRPPQDPALLDLAEGGEHHPNLVLAVLLGHHADEELPVFHRCGATMEKRGRWGVSQSAVVQHSSANNHRSHEKRRRASCTRPRLPTPSRRRFQGLSLCLLSLNRGSSCLGTKSPTPSFFHHHPPVCVSPD